MNEHLTKGQDDDLRYNSIGLSKQHVFIVVLTGPMALRVSLGRTTTCAKRVSFCVQYVRPVNLQACPAMFAAASRLLQLPELADEDVCIGLPDRAFLAATRHRKQRIASHSCAINRRGTDRGLVMLLRLCSRVATESARTNNEALRSLDPGTVIDRRLMLPRQRSCRWPGQSLRRGSASRACKRDSSSPDRHTLRKLVAGLHVGWDAKARRSGQT